METIYQKAFRNARSNQNISLSRFAPVLGVSKQLLSRIENGLQKPSIDLIKKLEKLTNLSFWALVAGDFENQNQHTYVKLSNLNLNTMSINFSELDVAQRNYLNNKFDVEIKELKDQIAEAKSRLAKRLEKSTLSEGELGILEAEVQKTKATLDYLTNNNAPAEMIADQKARADKAEADLVDKKRKGGIISDEEAILEQVMIEELELKIKLREDKITEIKAVV